MQINQVLSLPSKTPITTPVTGIVKAAYPLKFGTGQYGPWSRMDIVLQDDTGEIRVSWWEPTIQDPNVLIGQSISLQAYNTQQSQGVGCAVNEYQRKQDGAPMFDPATNQPIMVRQIKARGRALTMLSGAPPAQATLPQTAPMPGPAPMVGPVGVPAYTPPAARSYTAPTPAPQPSTAPQRLTEDQIIERLPKWADAVDGSLPIANSSEGECGRLRAIGAFLSTMAIGLGERNIALSPVQMPFPAEGQQPAAPTTPPDDDTIPF